MKPILLDTMSEWSEKAFAKMNGMKKFKKYLNMLVEKTYMFLLCLC